MRHKDIVQKMMECDLKDRNSTSSKSFLFSSSSPITPVSWVDSPPRKFKCTSIYISENLKNTIVGPQTAEVIN